VVNAKFKVGWLLVIACLVAMVLLLRPFFTAIAFAAVVAFLWHPVHFKLRKLIPENISAFTLTAITASVIITILASGASLLLSEFGRFYTLFSKLDVSNIFAVAPEFADSMKDVTRFFLSKIIENLSAIAVKLPYIVLSLLIFFLTLFFFIKDGERLAIWIKKNVPIELQKKEHIFKSLNNYMHAFINVWLLIGLLQAVVAVLGFFIFGLPYALLAGLIAAVLSIIPIIGPYAFYIPVGIYLILNGNVQVGIGILAYGLTLGSILDYGLRPYLASRWAVVHPLVILLGIFGGIATLGPAGFIIGPMILMIIVTFFKDYGLDGVFK
jgi:predicted PurR-regulated permease PerM